MLRSEHVYEEIKALIKAQDKADETEKAILKGQAVLLKLLLNIRQNQVSVLKHFNIEMITKDKVSDVQEEK